MRIFLEKAFAFQFAPSMRIENAILACTRYGTYRGGESPLLVEKIGSHGGQRRCRFWL